MLKKELLTTSLLYEVGETYMFVLNYKVSKVHAW